MWSLGCILAEMYTGYPIFPGENEQEQLSCIMELMGVPDKHLVDRSSRKRLFFGASPRFPALRATLIGLLRRLDWCASARRQFKGPPSPSWFEDAHTGAAVRRRALRRLHRQMPGVGSGAASEARSSNAAPVHRRLALAADEYPRSHVALVRALVDVECLPPCELFRRGRPCRLIVEHLDADEEDGRFERVDGAGRPHSHHVVVDRVGGEQRARECKGQSARVVAVPQVLRCVKPTAGL